MIDTRSPFTGICQSPGKGAMLLLCLVFPAVGPAVAKEPVLTRLVYHDRAAHQLKWVDIYDEKGKLVADQPDGIDGFPQLDSERQRLVQMRHAKDYILVGVRDDVGGEFGSGWVLVDPRVRYEDHGDHGHWYYQDLPSVRHSMIDKEQGNPAHLYVYDNVFYIANDALDGFTRLDPTAVPEMGEVPTGFHRGGGNHITLAVSGDRAFATWIDGEGENAGRVDITRIKPHGNDNVQRTFFLPTGVIHGAAATAGKVFFAPRDGVSWISADAGGQSMTPSHLSLGDPLEDETLRRTGAFATYREHLLCVSGSGKDAKLAVIDTRPSEPVRTSLSLEADDGHHPVTPHCVITPRGKHYAFVFNDTAEVLSDSKDQPDEYVTVVDLDRDDNGDFGDATVIRKLPIGPSAVEGHSGHHSVDCDADGRRAFIANPGDGTITIVRLDELRLESTITVGGAPASAAGGRER